MTKFVEKYIFSGFGFDVLVRNAPVKSVDGDEFLDIDMNELKVITAKALLVNSQKFTGNQIKFLRTFLKLSHNSIADKIQVPASTLRSWEDKGSAVSGLSLEQEKAFRIFVIHSILDQEKNAMDIQLALTKDFERPERRSAIDLSSGMKFSMA